MMRLFFVIFLIFVQSVPLSAQDPEPLDVPSILRTVTSLLSSDPKSLEYCKNFTDYLNLLEPPITSENITHSIKKLGKVEIFSTHACSYCSNGRIRTTTWALF